MEVGGTDYHEVQTALHAEQRSVGVPWRVTDFVTVGSPLTHARDLMAGKSVSLERRMDETEYPACPPRGAQQHSEIERAKRGEPVPLSAGQEGTGRLAFYRKTDDGPLMAHEASPFATTRWTNLYFPMKPWLGGILSADRLHRSSVAASSTSRSRSAPRRTTAHRDGAAGRRAHLVLASPRGRVGRPGDRLHRASAGGDGPSLVLTTDRSEGRRLQSAPAIPAHAASHDFRVLSESWAYGTTDPETSAGS